MGKDSLTTIYGIFFLILAMVGIIIGLIPFSVDYESGGTGTGSFFMFTPMDLYLFGMLLLIPAFILNIIFISSDTGITSGKVGFGLGLPGTLLLFISSISTVTLYSELTFISSITIVISLLLTIFTILLFTRIWNINIEKVESEPIQHNPPGSIPSFLRQTQIPPRPCPYCNSGLEWVAQYQKYYCKKCNKYI